VKLVNAMSKAILVTMAFNWHACRPFAIELYLLLGVLREGLSP
jgi:hypothetical protein